MSLQLDSKTGVGKQLFVTNNGIIINHVGDNKKEHYYLVQAHTIDDCRNMLRKPRKQLLCNDNQRHRLK